MSWVEVFIGGKEEMKMNVGVIVIGYSCLDCVFLSLWVCLSLLSYVVVDGFDN